MYHAWPCVTMVEWLLQRAVQIFWAIIANVMRIQCVKSEEWFLNVNSDCLIVTSDCVIVTKAEALELCPQMSIACMDIEKRYDCSTKMRDCTTIIFPRHSSTTAKFDFSFDILGWFSRWRYWQDSTECSDGSLRPTGSVLWILQQEVPR